MTDEHPGRREDTRTAVWLETNLAENLRVAEDDDAVLSSGESDVEPTRVTQESDALVLVASDATEDDVVLLAALEGVDRGDLNLLVELLLESAAELHVVDDVRPLALVGRDDANLGRQDARLEEFGDDLLDIGGLSPIQERRATRRDLLGAEVLVEHHRRIGDRPGEVNVLAQALGSRHTVLECALIEHVAREFGQAGVHPVLNLKPDRSVAKDNEALKERLREAGAGSLLIHDDRSELLRSTRASGAGVRAAYSRMLKEADATHLVVADEDRLLAAKDKGNHAFWLGGLSSLVDEHGAELKLGKPRVTRANTGAADDVGRVEDLLLASLNEALVLAFVALAELALALFELDELLKLRVRFGVGDLLVQGQKRDA